jgi:hypothetical protein
VLDALDANIENKTKKNEFESQSRSKPAGTKDWK